MPVLKSLPQWPNPHESIGRQIPSSRVGKRTVWWPRGPALEAFEKHIQPQIENNLRRIDLGHVDLFIRLYMIGRKPENANPIVMICCINSKARDLAEATIRESGLLDGHKGFGLGAATLPLEHPMPVRYLSPENEGRDYSTRSSKSVAANMSSELLSPLLEDLSIHPPSGETRPSSEGFSPIDPPIDQSLPPFIYTLPDATKPDMSNTSLLVFASTPQPLIGRHICISSNSSRSSLRYRYATAGVVIEVGGNYYQLTAGHLFELESKNLDTEQPPTQLDDCHFDGQSDDEQYDSDRDTEMTGRGSMTPEDAVSSDGSATDSAAEETKTGTIDSNDLSFVRGMQSSGGKGPENLTGVNLRIPIGYLPLNRSSRSPIDYAIIALPRSSVESLGHEINTPKPNLCVRNIAEVGYTECSILVITHSALIRGILIPGQLTFKGYQTHQFERLVQVELENPVFSGDCGSPVLNESTGCLYGHIIMGVPGTKVAYIVQAPDIFQDINAKTGGNASIATAKDLKEISPPTNARSHIPSRKSRSVRSETEHSIISNTSGSLIFSQGSGYSSIMTAPDITQPFFPDPGQGLPCEFLSYTSCDLVFLVNDVEGWIEHIVSDHLQGQLPDKCVCWFCDDFLFDSARVGSRTLNFQQRMSHIRSHILDGFSVHDIRPDYYLVKHLHHCGLISEEIYDSVLRYSEVPPPGSGIPHYEPQPSWQLNDRHHLYEYRNHEEERRDRRHRHKSGKSRN